MFSPPSTVSITGIKVFTHLGTCRLYCMLITVQANLRRCRARSHLLSSLQCFYTHSDICTQEYPHHRPPFPFSQSLSFGSVSLFSARWMGAPHLVLILSLVAREFLWFSWGTPSSQNPTLYPSCSLPHSLSSPEPPPHTHRHHHPANNAQGLVTAGRS